MIHKQEERYYQIRESRITSQVEPCADVKTLKLGKTGSRYNQICNTPFHTNSKFETYSILEPYNYSLPLNISIKMYL